MKSILFLFASLFSLQIFGQTIVNTPSINRYASVKKVDYCTNTLGVPPGKGGQFNIGDKVLIIQMKGAGLKDGNNANNGQVDNYFGAGNYEINEIKAINSSATDDILFKYEIERLYKTNGAVQIVSIPQYEDVVFQNTLTCQSWDGTTGGVLIFNATGTVTLNGNIDVSYKGFRGGIAEDIGGTNCFGGFGYSGYNCNYNNGCGAPKGEGIGNRYETMELARTPNANGGGGGNDHNAGGGGGSGFGEGGRGGDRLNGGCQGLGGFGGELLDFSKNRIFSSGGGGAGDAGNPVGSFGGTNGGNAGAIVFISAKSMQSNGNAILSNGEDVTALAISDGAGAGGAGGLIILDIENYLDVLNIESKGGEGGKVTPDSGCSGPGGGGSGGIVWLSQTNAPANLNLDAPGGIPGVVVSGVCMGQSNNGTQGSTGGYLYDFPSYVSDKDFIPLTLVAGSDTTICGEGAAPLWAKANSSYELDFFWKWSSGQNDNYNFDFNPQYGGYYVVSANAFFLKYDMLCAESYAVNVDIRRPKIEIVGSSFFGDTVTIGEPIFVNATVTPLNPQYIYTWTPSDKVEPNDKRNAVATPYETGEYCLKVEDELGCSKTECINLFVYEPKILSANAFTPNGDDLNNLFIPILTDDLEVVSFKVYNRWGDLVYETNENKPWDGTKSGKDLPLDLYIWNIQVKQILTDKVFTRQGDITIIR